MEQLNYNGRRRSATNNQGLNAMQVTELRIKPLLH